MSTGTENKVKGKFDEIAGKVKRAAGEAVNDQGTANRGAAQEVKGHAEQAWGSVQQAAKDHTNNSTAAYDEDRNRTSTSGQQTAHDIREKITSTAQNVKEHIQNHTDHTDRSRR